MFNHVSRMPQTEQLVKSCHVTLHIYQRNKLASYLNEHSKKVVVEGNLKGGYQHLELKSN